MHEPLIFKGMKLRHKLFGTVGHVEKIEGPFIVVEFDYPQVSDGPRGLARKVRVNKYILWEKYEAVK